MYVHVNNKIFSVLVLPDLFTKERRWWGLPVSNYWHGWTSTYRWKYHSAKGEQKQEGGIPFGMGQPSLANSAGKSSAHHSQEPVSFYKQIRICRWEKKPVAGKDVLVCVLCAFNFSSLEQQTRLFLYTTFPHPNKDTSSCTGTKHFWMIPFIKASYANHTLNTVIIATEW